MTIELMDMTGKVISQQTSTMQGNNTEMDVSNLENGLYLCRIITKGGISNNKITIIK